MHNNSVARHLFAESAQEFCKLVEQIEGYQAEQWLQAIGNILLNLETAVTELAASVPQTPHTWISDLEKRFELYSRIKDFLGLQDEYWSEADLHAGDGYMTGSLSDDFSDIYFELKRGLMLYTQGHEGKNEAGLIWTSSYRHHWRQHLIDARKQLFDFRTTAVKATRTSPPKIGRPPKKPV